VNILLKSILKQIKINESTISTFLGVLVIVVVGALVINYFRNLDTGSTLPTGISVSNDTEQQQQDEVSKELPTTYKVAKGDTLWSISEKHYNAGYNWVDIQSENNLQNANMITEGQELTIPKVAIRSPLEAPTELKASAGSYTVVHGDTLWDIALSHYGSGFKWIDIASANNLVNPHLIHAATIFVLP